MAHAALPLILALVVVAVPAYGFDFSFGAKGYVSKMILRASNIFESPKTVPEQTEGTFQQAAYFQCPLHRDGLYPNYEDCTTFFQCSGGQHSLQQCPGNLHYSEETQRCDYPCNAHCDQKLACQCKWDSCDNACLQPRDAGPCNREKQRYFYNSISGQCEIFIYGGCRGNRNNFKSFQNCRNACEKVPDSQLESSKPVKVSKSNDEFHCTADGLYPNPKNCRSFYECSNGKPHLMQCPGVLHFSQQTERCEDVCDAHCEKALACDCNWDSCEDACEKPLASGPCSGEIPRYFFNKTSGQCEKFLFGGCQGNENNFGTIDNCQQSCIDLCDLPPSKGPCDGQFEHWYYDSVKGECKTFIYGGCEGNANRFDSGVLCYDRCVLRNVKGPELQASQPFTEASDSTSLSAVFQKKRDHDCIEDAMFQNSENCSTFVQCLNGQAHLKACPTGLHFSLGTRRCESPCDARCDETLEEECCWNELQIYQKTRDDVCTLAPETGDCKGYYIMYYYDRYQGKCRKFNYGGCGGNANRFPTKEDCEDRCINEEEDGSSKDDIIRLPSHQNTDALEILKDWLEPMIDVICRRDGMYPNPLNCSMFVHCSKGKAYLKRCPSGLHFSSENQRCENPCDARCDRSLGDKCDWTVKEDNISRCRQLPEKGSCNDLYLRYYFDFTTGQCKSFKYGGCGGNSNNFETFQECEDSCLMDRKLDADVCSMPAEKGPCNENVKRYFFDAKTNTCQKFEYGGCDGNANNFRLIQFCKDRCIESKENSDISIGEESLGILAERTSEKNFVCQEENGLHPDPIDCGRFVQCSNGLAFSIPCPLGLHFTSNTQRCEKPCDARCNKNLACQCGWPECNEMSIDCEAHYAPGPCKNYETRYYYNRYIGKCQEFQYGGCGGNTNNFVNAADCKLKCVETMLDGYRCPKPNGKFPDFFDCITYYSCKNGTPTRKRCPEGLAFDHIKSACVIEYEAVCFYKCRDRDAVYSYRPDCHQYIDCVNGIAKVERCEPGTAFDFRVRNCVDEKLISCSGAPK